MDMNFIDAMIEDIVSQKKTVDNVAFLNSLKEELDRKGITLTVNCQKAPFLDDNIITSSIVGIELDLSEHDRKKDAEIEKYRKMFENVKRDRETTVSQFQNEVNSLKEKIRNLEESRKEFPLDPIKIADYLIDKCRKPRTDYLNRCIKCLEENRNMFDDDTHRGLLKTELTILRQIAEHILVYCTYTEEL